MKLPNMNCHRARSLFKKGIEKVVDLANSKTVTIENILLNSIDFDCEIQRDNENEGEAQKRIKRRNFFITGKSSGLTVVEAAKILIEDARKFVEFEMGAKNVNWSNTGENEQIVTDIVQPNDDLMTNSLKKRKATTPLLATSQVFQKKQQKTDISTPKNSRRSKGDLEMSATYRERLRSSRNSSLNGSLLEISPKINRSIDEITSSQKSFDDYTKRFSHLTSTQIGNSTRTHKTRSTVADSNKENSDNRSLFHHSILIDPETVKSLDISEESSRVKIIDVLAKESIFMSFLAEVAGKNEITLSVGVKKFEKTSQKIGGTLMSRNDLISEDEHQFVFHNHYFVDCLSICYENGIVCYLNLQQAKKSEMITILKRFLVELFQRPDLMINIFDAKEQLKVLIKVIPEIRDFNVKVMDPKIAYWLINPDKDVNMEKMVHDFAPDMKEIFELAKSSLGLNHCSNVAPKIR